MDLGECPQIHDLALRADYEAAQKKRDHFYDIDVSIHFIALFYWEYKLVQSVSLNIAPAVVNGS